MKRLASFAALAALIFLSLKAPRSPLERHPLRDALASPHQSFDGLTKDDSSGTDDLKASFQKFKSRDSSHHAQPAEVDLKDQFPPNKIPDQGKVGSCHDFAAIALLEAAFYRYYKIHMGFSEADLFAQTQMCGGLVCNQAEVYKAVDGSMQCSLGEGGNAGRDLEFILNHGILTDEGKACAPYAQFEKNYRERFQQPLEKALLNLHACGRSLPKVEPGKLKNTADRWERPSPQAQVERESVKEALSGFSLSTIYESRPLDLDLLLRISPRKCLDSSRRQRELLSSQLEAGRPVAVSMQLRNLKSWVPELRPTSAPDSTANHAFLIVGYRAIPGGEPTFQTRNSWIKDGKPYNPDLSSDELCHIYRIFAFLTPDEARQN